MIIVDSALERREFEKNPVRVAMVGAGYMGRGIAFQMVRAARGMRLVGIANRTLSEAQRAFADAGAEPIRHVRSGEELDEAIAAGQYAVSEDPTAMTDAEAVDVVI